MEALSSSIYMSGAIAYNVLRAGEGKGFKGSSLG